MPTEAHIGIFSNIFVGEVEYRVNLINIQKVINLRTNKGWSQGELARAASVNKAVISRLESGNQKEFRLSVVMAIASALEVTVDHILIYSKTSAGSKLIPELEYMVLLLSGKPEHIQRHVLGILRGYLAETDQER